MRATARYVLLTAVVAAFTLVSLARDARADDVEAARRDFAEGVRLYQRNDFEGARRLFKKADSEHHAAPMIYNLGLAEERLLHSQAAVDAYEAYIAEARDTGEFSSAASVAIAQIKARSTRLRIDTKPSGARLFVDGSAVSEPAPTTFLVPAGHHLIVAEGDGWRGEEAVEVRGVGDTLAVVVKAKLPNEPVTAPVVAPALPETSPVTSPVAAPPAVDPDAAARTGGPSAIVWGASFALAPYHMLGAAKGMENERPATRVAAGAIVEIGHAVTDRFEFLARGMLLLGPEAKPSYAAMGGPGVSFRVGSSFWFGAAFLGGQIETRWKNVRYGTGLVFGAMAEASYALLSTSLGQWTLGVQPGLLLTDEGQDNTALFFPISFGYRAY